MCFVQSFEYVYCSKLPNHVNIFKQYTNCPRFYPSYQHYKCNIGNNISTYINKGNIFLKKRMSYKTV